jgi:hypothetical protein
VKRTYHKQNNSLTVSFSNNYLRKATKTINFLKVGGRGEAYGGMFSKGRTGFYNGGVTAAKDT